MKQCFRCGRKLHFWAKKMTVLKENSALHRGSISGEYVCGACYEDTKTSELLTSGKKSVSVSGTIDGNAAESCKVQTSTSTWFERPDLFSQFIYSWSEKLETSVANWRDEHRQMCTRIYRELRTPLVCEACATAICEKGHAAYGEGKLHSAGIRFERIYVLVYAIPYGVREAIERDFGGSYVGYLWGLLNHLGSLQPSDIPDEVERKLSEGAVNQTAQTWLARFSGALRSDFVNILVFFSGDCMFSTLVLVERMDLSAPFHLPVHVIPETLCSDKEEHMIVKAGCTLIRSKHDPFPQELR